MQLTYRGLPYESTSEAIDIVPAETPARYRGNFYSILYPIDSLTHSLNLTLRYRGIAYSKG